MSLSRPLLFFHIEKAGGSSIEDVVTKHVLSDAPVLPGHRDAAQARLIQGLQGEFADINRTVMIPGHFGLSPFLLEQTMLRLVNHTACAIAFMGHFSALPLMRLLVRIDRGDYGPVRCQRWSWVKAGDVTTRAWEALAHSNCVTVVRDPFERARSSWNFFNYAGGSNCRLHCGGNASGYLRSSSGWCADCVPDSFHEAISKYGADRVLKKTHGSIALHRFGSLSGGLASSFDSDASEEDISKLKRAKCTLDRCRVVGISTDINAVLRAVSVLHPSLPCGTTSKANWNHWNHGKETTIKMARQRKQVLSRVHGDMELYNTAKSRGQALSQVRCGERNRGLLRPLVSHGDCV